MSFLRHMPLIVCAIVYIGIYLPQICANSSENIHHYRSGKNVPCAFVDTVNVTNDVRFPNGSYLHDGFIIPKHLVGLYDYIYEYGMFLDDVEPHYRGCICKLKPCINFCCPWGFIFDTNETKCVNTTDDIIWPRPVLNITLSDNTLKTVNIHTQFGVQNFRPCINMYTLRPDFDDFDAWKIFENGSLLVLENEDNYIGKNEYCMTLDVDNDTSMIVALNPALCSFQSEFSTMKTINAIAMLFSIPFMILTIIIYLAIPELRNQHGKSLACYLLGLIVGYTSLALTSLLDISDMPQTICKYIGFMTYFFFMAAFFWLSVISFDLWHNFRGTHGINRFKEKKRFLIYSLYAWGLAVLCLILTWLAQEYFQLSAAWSPGIGVGVCWLNVYGWSAMIYFFGPIMLVILANTIMFIMTAHKIHRVQREMARIMAREDSTRNLRSEKDRFGLFLRLFIVMGVTWSLEIISYFIGSNQTWAKIFYITDICNASQGFIIFMLFVIKKKVKNLITKRYTSIRSEGGQRQSQYSTKTTSSSVANLAMTTTMPVEKPLMQHDRNTNGSSK